jgi:ABC-type cobalamin transport system ATPase subunit
MLKMIPILLKINADAFLFSRVTSSIKLINPNIGNISTLLNSMAEAIQKAGSLTSEGTSVF